MKDFLMAMDGRDTSELFAKLNRIDGLLPKMHYLAGLQHIDERAGIRFTRFIVVSPHAKDVTNEKIAFKDCLIDICVVSQSVERSMKDLLSVEASYIAIEDSIDRTAEEIRCLVARCGRYPSKADGGCTFFGVFGF